MTAYADLDISQGEDFALQLFWTDQINQPYKVCHPMRLQARAATGQTVLDLFTADQAEELPSDASRTLVYSTEGGVVQAVVPSDVTNQLPAGEELFYDLFVSYESQSSDFITGGETITVRLAKILQGKIRVQGRVTKSV